MNDSKRTITLTRFSFLTLLVLSLALATLRGAASSRAHHSGIIQAPALPGAQPISPRDRIYTVDQVSNTVTVINPATNEVLGTIPVGNVRLDGIFSPLYAKEINTHGIGFSPDGSKIDVISVTTNSAVIIDTASNTIEDTYYLGRAAHEGFISPDGRELWVAIRGLDYVSVVDLRRGRETDRIQTAPGPSMVVFSPDGKLAYVDHARTAELDVIHVRSHRVIARITGLVSPFSPNLAVSPDGAEVWLTHKDIGKVTVIDARNFEVLTVLDTGPVTNHVNFISKPEANYAYVTIGGRHETLVYRRNGANPELVGSIPHSGMTPHGLWPSPDNTRMYVVMENSDSLDVIDTGTMEVIATLRIGQQPQTMVYVANAVPEGDGLANLSQQGLNRRIENLVVTVNGTSGTGIATIREVENLDMIEVAAQELSPDTAYIVSFENDQVSIPGVRFVSDSLGRGSALAFTKFFGVFDRVSISPE